MHTNPLSITHEIKDAQTVNMKLFGNLTLQAEAVLTEQAEKFDQQNYNSIELDFSELHMINGAGLKHLVIFLVRSQRMGLTITAHGLNEETIALFKLTHLDDIIHILENE